MSKQQSNKDRAIRTMKALSLALTLAALACLTAGPTQAADGGLDAVLAGKPAPFAAFDTADQWHPAPDVASGDKASAVIAGAGPSTHPATPDIAGASATGQIQSLKVNLSLPSAAGVCVTPPPTWQDLAALRFAIYLPQGAPSTMSLGVYVKDNEWWWYDTFPLRQESAKVRRAELAPGRWNPVTVDMRPEATGWMPGGHKKPWIIASRPFLELGLVFYSKEAFQGTVEISPINGWSQVAQPITGPAVADHVELYPGKNAAQWHAVTVNMHLARHYENPFDPAQVDMEGQFDGPMGPVTMPGFVYQDYELGTDGVKPIPIGDVTWKVRFTPTLPGKYTYRVTLKDAGGTAVLTSGSFFCRAAADHGFVRISKKDPRMFSFDDHSFFYPIGLNVRHAGDNVNVHEGLPAIQKIYNKMASVGLTWTRTWMCSWWLAIEWSHQYDARFHGVGQYNLSNAWLLDQTLQTADKDGLYVELTLNNHGQFSTHSDPEWQYNPYSTANGGKLTAPQEFFTDPWAKQMFKQRLRYIVARWGYSPNIFAWEMFNEVDLTDAYSSPVVSAWMTEMADYMHSIDPYQHLVSTHVCWWTADVHLWANPALQFVQADGYVRWRIKEHDTMATFTDEIWPFKARFGKPAYIVEFGYKQSATDTDPSPQFHPGIWAGFMSPFSADSMYWDWYVVDRRNFWPQYAAIVRFARGEDRRGQDLGISWASMAPGSGLNVRAISNNNRAYAWVYDVDRQNAWIDGATTYDWVVNDSGVGSAKPTTFTPVTGGQLTVPGLKDGAYHVEFWDTWKGQVTGEADVESKNGRLVVPLPPVTIDLALKIKQK